MPTAVVTGGAGFLGSHLCDYFWRATIGSSVIDNLETGSLENIAHIGRGPEFEFRYHDVVEHIHIDEAVDVVYHLAALASPIDYMRLPLHSLKVGSYGTHNALGLAKHKRARFLLASTSEVYGDPLQSPQPESYWGNVNPVGPRGVYDEAKRYAEALTMAYHHQQGVDTCIARIFNTYGPRMRRNDGRASVTFIQQALAGNAAHGVRRRLPDAQPLLRRRHGSRARRARGVGRAPAGEHRQPGSRDDDARARADGRPRHRVVERDHVRGGCRTT